MTITVTVTAKDGAGNVVTFTETREVPGTTDWNIVLGHVRRNDASVIESLAILTLSAELFTSFWKSYWGRAGMPARVKQLKALYDHLRPFLDEAVKSGEAVAVDEPYQAAMAKEEDPGPAGCPLVWSEDGNSAHTCAAVIRDLKLSHEEITNQRDRAQEALAKSEHKNLDLQRMLLAHRTTLRKLREAAENLIEGTSSNDRVPGELWSELSTRTHTAKEVMEDWPVGVADTELDQVLTVLRTLVTHALELGYGEAPAEQDDGSLGRKMDRAVDAAYKFLEKYPV